MILLKFAKTIVEPSFLNSAISYEMKKGFKCLSHMSGKSCIGSLIHVYVEESAIVDMFSGIPKKWMFISPSRLTNDGAC